MHFPLPTLPPAAGEMVQTLPVLWPKLQFLEMDAAKVWCMLKRFPPSFAEEGNGYLYVESRFGQWLELEV